MCRGWDEERRRGWGGAHNPSVLSHGKALPQIFQSILLFFLFFFFFKPAIWSRRKHKGERYLTPAVHQILTFLNLHLAFSHSRFYTFLYISLSLLFSPCLPGVPATVPCHVTQAARSGSTLLETGHDTPTAPPPRDPPPHTLTRTHTHTHTHTRTHIYTHTHAQTK